LIGSRFRWFQAISRKLYVTGLMPKADADVFCIDVIWGWRICSAVGCWSAENKHFTADETGAPCNQSFLFLLPRFDGSVYAAPLYG